ncbi:MAG: peptidoglycan-binding protein, partial [Actinomycetia bacterium]|nr:peptidoglycan-binding protein [Actinomycetes bacterium]
MSQSRTRSPLHLVGLRAIGAVAAPVMVAPLLATGTAHAAPIVQYAVPGPPQPQVTLPAEVDVAPTYQAQTTCDPSPKPGAVAFARLLNAHYGTRVYGISRACGNGVTEHSEGRALDWMINANVPREKAIADSVVQWLSATDERGNVGAMARRFGINYIIWNRKIWRAYAPARGWANYTGPHPHHDHIHISFTWDGAYQRTSWWTGRALGTISVDNGRPGSAPPAVTPVMTNLGYLVLRLGSSNDDVRVLQRALNTSVDGLFGSGTERAVRDFQSRHRLMTDGIAGPQTWAKLIELGLAPSRTGATPTPTPTPTPPAATHPLKQFSTQTVRRGSRGAAVTALQRALGGVAVDGSFGPATERALLAYQESKQLNPDGVVNANVWNALMDLDYTKTAPAPAPTPSPTPTPEPTPAAHALEAHSAQTLRRGATGAAVTALQRALGGIDADGSFGPATER